MSAGSAWPESSVRLLSDGKDYIRESELSLGCSSKAVGGYLWETLVEPKKEDRRQKVERSAGA